jgi:hypothetical protein
MSIETIIQAVLAIGTILGGAIAAYATYRNTNSSVKVQEKQLDLEEARFKKEVDSFGVEEAERISNISISNLQLMQQIVVECNTERTLLRQENNRLTLENTQQKIKIMKATSKVKSLLEKHEKLYADNKIDCAGFTVIQDMIREMIYEIEQEVQ